MLVRTMFAFFALLVAVTFVVVPGAEAALTLPTSLSTTDVEAVASLVLASLVVIWSIRKVIKTVNRS